MNSAMVVLFLIACFAGGCLTGAIIALWRRHRLADVFIPAPARAPVEIPPS